jgi:hypothetical protein
MFLQGIAFFLEQYVILQKGSHLYLSLSNHALKQPGHSLRMSLFYLFLNLIFYLKI